MNLRFINWIWHVRGSVPLTPRLSSDEAFNRLDPLFREFGTSHERQSDTLVFRKKDQAAQDKMSIFDGGVLQIDKGAAAPGVVGPVLRYDLISRALLFCFLAPLMFLGIGQLTVFLGEHQKPAAETAASKAEEAKKKIAAKNAEVPMNPIDKFLGAPAPEKPKKDDQEGSGRHRKPSPTTAYVFAAIFATLYVIGRILEDRLVKRLFRRRLLAS